MKYIDVSKIKNKKDAKTVKIKLLLDKYNLKKELLNTILNHCQKITDAFYLISQ